ncbi:MAG: hypothetical protein IPN68_17900 [Bacteroidetes bacterium]|nr:hypothetical protein [Bacteroidota bacterium]
MNSPGEIRAYFELIAEENNAIRQFYYGDYDDILGAERVRMEYPLLWLEDMEVRPNSEDSTNLIYDFSFVVLQNSPPEQKERVLYNHESTFRIAMQILSRLKKDIHEELIDMSLDDVTMDPVNTIGNDNDQGWRVTLRISAYTTLCYNADEWAGDYPTGAIARFKATRSLAQDGDGNQVYVIAAENLSVPDDNDFSWRWVYKIDAGEYEETGDEILMVADEFSVLYIELQIWNESDERKIYASAVMRAGESEVRSYPFRYNPL